MIEATTEDCRGTFGVLGILYQFQQRLGVDRNRGFLEEKWEKDCLVQVLKERGLRDKTEDNPFKV